MSTAEQPGAQNWWSARFLELLESFGVGSRLERGRRYARDGHVCELDVEPGIVLARVQGARYTPYCVRIRARPLSEHQWRRAERAMAAQALPLAQLLAGAMPPDIEQILAAANLTLFPASYTELKATCDCPDAENPCKHIAAVYYLLAERFDDDPLAIFTWRGRPPDELLDDLRKRRARRPRATVPTPAGTAPDPPAGRGFWTAGAELDTLSVRPLAGERPDALVCRPGGALVIDGRDVTPVLADMYAKLAHAAEQRAVAD